VLASAQNAAAGVANASFDLTDGTDKIRATAAGFLESWYTTNSGRDDGAFAELPGYQDRDTSRRRMRLWWTPLRAPPASLSYGATSDTYTYVWKTQKAWAGT
jgi:hypothetical protein